MADRDAIDGSIGLIVTAARETPRGRTAGSLDHSRVLADKAPQRALIQREVLDYVGVLGIADSRLFRFDQANSALDFNRGLDGSDLEADVNAAQLLVPEAKAPHDESLEARRFSAQDIVAFEKLSHSVVPAFVRFRGVHVIAVYLRGCDERSDNHRPMRVGYQTGDCGKRSLGESIGSKYK